MSSKGSNNSTNIRNDLAELVKRKAEISVCFHPYMHFINGVKVSVTLFSYRFRKHWQIWNDKSTLLKAVILKILTCMAILYEVGTDI